MSKKGMSQKQFSVRKIAFLGLLLSLALVFSYFEAILTPLLALPPGIKIGFSNIVVMYCLFFLNAPSAVTLVFLKSFFVLLTRGIPAFFMSIAGGLLSVLVMFFLIKLKRVQVSYLLISVFGGAFHNVGQIVMASVLIGSGFAIAYLPLLLVSGVGMGILTGLLYKAASPYLRQLNNK